MSQQGLWQAFAVVAGIALAVQLWLPRDPGERVETSWDHAPRGQTALLALLERFEATPGRWLSGLTMPDPGEPLWLVAPLGVCESRSGIGDDRPKPAAGEEESEGASGEPAVADPGAPFRYVVQPWIEAGGTAIVWLSHPPLPDEKRSDDPRSDEASDEGGDPDEAEEGHPRRGPAEIREDWRELLERQRASLREGRSERCAAIAGHALPARRLSGLEGGALPREGPFSKLVFSVGRAVGEAEDFDYEAARMLPGSTLAFFEVEDETALSGWRPLWVEADSLAPFALARSLGAGRLVVVADARIVSNARLAQGDAAPFAFDWVRDYGRPWIDEHFHGVVPESRGLRYLVGSPAWAAGVGLLALGGLVCWRGRAWPLRRVDEVDPDAPTLSTFVDSVALLYAGTRDHERVFERYRALGLERIRRILGLAPGTPVEIVVAMLRAREGAWQALGQTGFRDLLTRSVPVASAEELVRLGARLDALVAVVREARAATARAHPGPGGGASDDRAIDPESAETSDPRSTETSGRG
jgi:hypothetical protein